MSTIQIIAQPGIRTTLQAIDGILQMPALHSISIAAAYITNSGTRDLLKVMVNRNCAENLEVRKKWITSFDYCRTDPIALNSLLSMPNSLVKIHGATACLNHKGTPKQPFHPKAFLFRSNTCAHLLAGSGNISHSGLSNGFEAGLVISSKMNPTETTCIARAPIAAFQGYFDSIWNNAEPLTTALLARYQRLFESADHLRNPTPTEDDIAPDETNTGNLSSDDLGKLRVCRHFWIQAGNITKNRGPSLPGNQIMMKRLSRVFFGFEPKSVPQNSAIGKIKIRFGTQTRDDCSLTYSDNKMDKLVLPIPGDGGPPNYNNEVLMFERISPDTFKLSLGTATDFTTWHTKSGAIGGAFTMSKGRQWGVY